MQPLNSSNIFFTAPNGNTLSTSPNNQLPDSTEALSVIQKDENAPSSLVNNNTNDTLIIQKLKRILDQIDKSVNVANQWLLTQLITEVRKMPEIDPDSIKIHGSIDKNKETGAYIIRLSKSTESHYGLKITCTFKVTVTTQSKPSKNYCIPMKRGLISIGSSFGRDALIELWALKKGIQELAKFYNGLSSSLEPDVETLQNREIEKAIHANSYDSVFVQDQMGQKLTKFLCKSREVGLIEIPYEETTSGYYVVEKGKLTKTTSSAIAYSHFNVGRTVYESKLHYLKNAPFEIIDKRNLQLKAPEVIHSFKISRYLDHVGSQVEKIKGAFSTSLLAFLMPTDFDRYQKEVKTLLASSKSLTEIPLGKRQYIQSYINKLENLKAISHELQQTENLLKKFSNQLEIKHLDHLEEYRNLSVSIARIENLIQSCSSILSSSQKHLEDLFGQSKNIND